MEYVFIDTKEALDVHINEILSKDYIAIDTEFLRNNTYYPKLSLLQICYKKGLALVIDCLAVDISELLEIIYDEKIKKIFHSSRQDLEILYYKKGFLPKNLFDTQIAVLAFNFTKDLSYEKIVKMLLNVDLDKSQKSSNWLKRPLDEDQIKYAAYDALYLFEIYEIIIRILSKYNRESWLEDTFKELEDSSIYENKINKDIKKIGKDPSIINISIAYDLLDWRENLAKQLDLPRNNILNTDIIKNLARLHIYSKEELEKVLEGSYSLDILEEIYAILQKEKREIILQQNYYLTKNQADIYNILKIVLNTYGVANKLNDSLIASQEELINFVINKEQSGVKFLEGWRFKIFGEVALDFINGKKSMTILEDKIFIK